MKGNRFQRLIKGACLAGLAVAVAFATSFSLTACGGGGGGEGSGTITVKQFLYGDKMLILDSVVRLQPTSYDPMYTYCEGNLIVAGKQYPGFTFTAEPDVFSFPDAVPTKVTISGSFASLNGSDKNWFTFWGAPTAAASIQMDSGNVVLELQIVGPTGTYSVKSPSTVQGYKGDSTTMGDPVDVTSKSGSVQVLPSAL